MGWFNKCSDWAVRQEDTEEEVRIKRLAFPVLIGVFVVQMPFLVQNLLAQDYFQSWGRFLVCLPLFMLCGFTVGRGDVKRGMDIVLGLFTVGLLVTDLSKSSALRPRVWSYVVIVLDAVLVFDRPKVVPWVLAVTMLYLLAEKGEAVFRLGLYEWVMHGGVPVCDCGTPPCGADLLGGVGDYVGYVILVLTDFHLTRGFATNLRQQVRKMGASVAVAAEIAGALSRYDVDGSERAIAEAQDLPEELAVSFKQLVFNLRSYRAYLPHSCLVTSEESILCFDVIHNVNSSTGNSPGRQYSSLSEIMERDLTGSNQGMPPNRNVEPMILSLTNRNMTGSMGRGVADSMSRVTDSMNRGMAESSSGKSTPRMKDDVRSMFGMPPPQLSSSTSGPTDRRAMPRRARVTLAAANRIGYLSIPEDIALRWIEEDVDGWCATVTNAKGLVDLIMGDRRYASFNARKGCAEHSKSAVAVLSYREGEHWSGSVVTGGTICGDFGSVSVLRFMVIGPLSYSLHPLERIAAQWRIKVLADAEAYHSASYDWDAQLLGAVFMVKRGDKPIRLYSMTSPREESKGGPEEWMYQIEKMGDSKHAAANKEKEKLIREGFDSVPEPPEPGLREGAVVWRVSEVGLRSAS
eukprot:Hpha_TRINITY_DN15361_c4_g2::TRINITY_DN15361_c4_g2_i1::g.88019::m.88019